MGILAVTRAAETCDRCDNPSHACRSGGLSVGRPAPSDQALQRGVLCFLNKSDKSDRSDKTNSGGHFCCPT
jgi:hypothetical protein